MPATPSRPGTCLQEVARARKHRQPRLSHPGTARAVVHRTFPAGRLPGSSGTAGSAASERSKAKKPPCRCPTGWLPAVEFPSLPTLGFCPSFAPAGPGMACIRAGRAPGASGCVWDRCCSGFCARSRGFASPTGHAVRCPPTPGLLLAVPAPPCSPPSSHKRFLHSSQPPPASPAAAYPVPTAFAPAQSWHPCSPAAGTHTWALGTCVAGSGLRTPPVVAQTSSPAPHCRTPMPLAPVPGTLTPQPTELQPRHPAAAAGAAEPGRGGGGGSGSPSPPIYPCSRMWSQAGSPPRTPRSCTDGCLRRQAGRQEPLADPSGARRRLPTALGTAQTRSSSSNMHTRSACARVHTAPMGGSVPTRGASFKQEVRAGDPVTPQPPRAPTAPHRPCLAHARSHARLGTGTPWVLAHTRSPSLCTKTSSNPCTPCLPLVCAHSHRYQSGPCALPNLQTSLAVPGTLRPRSPGRVLPRPSTVPPFPLGQGAAQGPGTPHPAPTTSSPRVPTGTAGTGTGHTAKTGLGSRQETVPRRPPSPPPSIQSPSAPTLQGTV